MEVASAGVGRGAVPAAGQRVGELEGHGGRPGVGGVVGGQGAAHPPHRHPVAVQRAARVGVHQGLALAELLVPRIFFQVFWFDK